MILSLILVFLMQMHRAEQDREISYWLLEPDTHQFRISHDFNVGQGRPKIRPELDSQRLHCRERALFPAR